jgi:tetratricopeptide (TPR) repeat protein
MALSHYGISISQTEIGNDLRPYQHPTGDNDDKSVTLAELAEKSREFGFTPFYRPNGNSELVKKFITYDMPVIARTWLKPDEDIGHYRVVKGYNQRAFIQDDSLQGKNLTYTYSDFDAIWKQFNYEYLVLVPDDKLEIAKTILGPDYDEKDAWERAASAAREQLKANPSDVHAGFNLSIALYNIGDFSGSVREFEKVEDRLSPRTLWYQIEPIQAYYELENYDRVMEITSNILNNNNRAFSELYIIRGNVYLQQGNKSAAKAEFEKAVQYNRNLQAAQDALESVQ